MEQLKRWADNVCVCAFCLPASISASEFQVAGRQKPRFSQSSARPKKIPTFCSAAPGRQTSGTVAPPFGPAQKLRRSFQHSARASHESHSSPSCSPAQFLRRLSSGFFSLAKFRHFSTNKLISIWKVLFFICKFD